MTPKELKDFNLKVRIIERAEAMGITKGNRVTEVLDVDNAVKQFDMRLEDWYRADDVNFAHDFIGIQANINRMTGRIENLFVPRFAKGEGTTRADKMKYIAQSMTILVNHFIRQPIEITYRREDEESVKDYTDWGRRRFGIVPGDEYFYVWRGEMLYAKNVSADSPLAAAEELIRLLADKF